MTSLKEQVSDLIEDHCAARAEYRRERTRVTLGELSGMPDPAVVKSVEDSLSIVYGLLSEASERLAAVSAVIEFGGNDG
jgi:hypothetical protein